MQESLLSAVVPVAAAAQVVAVVQAVTAAAVI